MTQPSAKVTSVETLDAFKASLIIYLEKAGRILDEVSDDVVRTRVWLETDRQLHWKNLARQRSKELAHAEQELLTARLSDMPEAVKARRMTVNKAKLALGEAENGLNRVKQWVRQYEAQVQSRTRAVAQLRHCLAHDMTKAVAFLETAAKSLAAYAAMPPPERAPQRQPSNSGDGEFPADAAASKTPASGGDAS